MRATAAASLAAMLLVAGCRTVPQPEPPVPAEPELRFEAVTWESLPGWQQDRTVEAWPALLASCGTSRMAAAWQAFCVEAAALPAQDARAQRRLIEDRLRAYRVTSYEGAGKRSDAGLITGYYEPVLKGSRRKSTVYQWPLHAVPEDLVTVDLAEVYPALQGVRVRGKLQGRRVVPYPDRAQLAAAKTPAGKELLWVDSAVDAFFLEIQGSGRVRLDDGSTVRLAFADVNGRPYRAIGRYLVDQGEMTAEQATAPALRDWLRQHPDRQQEVFNQNPSVVFFREEKLPDPAVGPRGALGVPLTPGRSVAIDPRWLPLGAPLYLSTTDPLSAAPLQRLVLAQDTGGAIRGAIRADLFWGWNAPADEAAGRMRGQGSLWLLWPAEQAPPAPSLPRAN
ncbi:MAG TPA: murein transglycosylase A [Steroidobacteraceae bacterium]|nr:murein transglycosylase A [Steroidobacteraceae bacterium]